MHRETFRVAWQQAWHVRAFRRSLVTTGLLLALTLVALGPYLHWIDRRAGVPLADPLLGLVPPLDATWLTFAFIYLGVVGAVSLLITRPWALLLAGQAYVIVTWMRCAALWLTPLEPPAGMIYLSDPIVGIANAEVSRDLFFSGHVATLSLFTITAPSSRARWLLAAATIVVAASLLVQHVHYTIDVVSAPVFAYAACRMARHCQPSISTAASDYVPPDRTRSPAR